jgi:hypothetical protein
VRSVRGAVLLALIVAYACSDHPSKPSPTASGLTITPTLDVLLIPSSQTLTATATFSDGSTRVVTPAWTIDDQRVATVDANGRITAVSPGAATLVASFEGRTTTMPLRAVPNYAGSWSGGYRQVACDAPDTSACHTYPPNVVPPPVLRLTAILEQRGASVAGRIEFFSNDRSGGVVNVTGAITLEGRLDLDGPYVTNGTTTQGHIVDWRSTLDQPGQDVMHGGFSSGWVALSIGPMVHVTYELDGLAHVSTGTSR